MNPANMKRLSRLLSKLELLSSDEFYYELKIASQWLTLSINGDAAVSYRRDEGDDFGLDKLEAFLASKSEHKPDGVTHKDSLGHYWRIGDTCCHVYKLGIGWVRDEPCVSLELTPCETTS